MKEPDLKNTMTLVDYLATVRRVAATDPISAADQEHRERIHAEIANDLDDLDKTGPLNLFGIVEAIAAGRIRHLTINY